MPSRFPTSLLLVFFITLFDPLSALMASEPLQKLESCTLIPTKWADGDSFLVRTASGKDYTVRLYGADCLEASVTDPSDARRLRAQRRYFGITTTNPDPKTAIRIAKGFGEKAKEETKRFLTHPFTVHTAFSDARGDGRYQRIYAFVIDRNGRDLAAHLVAQGLARAYGVSRQSFDGSSAEDYREKLSDLELLAAKRERGVWALTDWNALPAERRKQREEEAEAELALDDQKLAAGTKLNPNTAARDELMRLPGIGETMANRIISERPFGKAEELLRVNGIGKATLKKLRPFLTFQ